MIHVNTFMKYNLYGVSAIVAWELGKRIGDFIGNKLFTAKHLIGIDNYGVISFEGTSTKAKLLEPPEGHKSDADYILIRGENVEDIDKNIESIDLTQDNVVTNHYEILRAIQQMTTHLTD